MGRFLAKDMDMYSTSDTNYFSLKNDGDVANVRFMYNSIEDVGGYAVHKVKVGDRERYVNCLREYNEPIDKCPFCKAGIQQKVRMFIPLYDNDDNTTKVWERGKQFYPELVSQSARYVKDEPLVSHTFDIERRGRAGDQRTTYGLFSTGSDDTLLEDLPEVPKIIGTIILDKSAEDMEYYLRNGEFPIEGEAPIRRRTETEEHQPSLSVRRRRAIESEDTSAPVRRRTPSSVSSTERF